MSSFGVIPTGFGVKPFDTIKAEIEQEQLDNISAGLNHSTQSLLTRLNVIYADKAAELWEVALAVYQSLDPNAASGAALDALAAITGAERLPAQASTVTLEFTATAAATVPIGTIVSVSGAPDVRFATDAELVFVGAGTQSVTATATTTGPLDAAVGALTVLENPIPNISSVTNPLKPDLGRDLETDPELRERRQLLLAAVGGSTVDAIRTDVAGVTGVDAVAVFENVLDVISSGRPPHSIEVLVQGGADDDIAQAIHDTKPAGIATYSDTGDSGTAVNNIGQNITINFTRPTDVPIFIEIDIVFNGEATTPATILGVQEAIRDYFLSLEPGDDVLVSQIICVSAQVLGVGDVLSVLLDTVSPPVGTTNIAIGFRDLATIDHLNDITVV